jgi:quercetin dioxygenase-like cupin family protein
MVRTSASEPTVLVGTAEAVPVTAGATTSRVLVDNDAVRVVAFAFDAGEQLTEHTASLPVVVQVLRGAVRFTVGDGSTSSAAATASTCRRTRATPSRRSSRPS